jgi:hypothetical protein
LVFEVEPAGGEISISAESTDCKYFSLDELERMQILEPHLEQIVDALAGETAAFIR